MHIAHNRRSASPVSVLAFDLNHFKSIHDRRGHLVGDAVLQLFAKVARETLRGTDILGRLGGEEFVALLPATLAEAAIAAERVRSAFAAARIVRNGQRIAATVSIGVACSLPSVAIDLLITRADHALYRAKANGRDRVETADDELASAPEAIGGERERPRRRRAQQQEKGAVNNGAVEVALPKAMPGG